MKPSSSLGLPYKGIFPIVIILIFGIIYAVVYFVLKEKLFAAISPDILMGNFGAQAVNNKMLLAGAGLGLGIISLLPFLILYGIKTLIGLKSYRLVYPIITIAIF